jgi:phospholipid N-methyltransferase
MNISAAFKYTKRIASTGALFQTSKKVEKEISRFVDSSKPQIIIEYGAGHGNLTRAILSKMHSESKLYAFEIHGDFCEELQSLNDPRLKVVNDSAEKINEYVKEDKVDCIISSIPFSYIPTQVLHSIIEKSYQKLCSDGVMSQVLYSTYHLKKYKQYFGKCETKVLLSIPLEFIYHCHKV